MKEPASVKEAKQAQRAQQHAAEPASNASGLAKGAGANGVANGDGGSGEGGLSDSGDEVEDYERRPRSNAQVGRDGSCKRVACGGSICCCFLEAVGNEDC